MSCRRSSPDCFEHKQTTKTLHFETCTTKQTSTTHKQANERTNEQTNLEHERHFGTGRRRFEHKPHLHALGDHRATLWHEQRRQLQARIVRRIERVVARPQIAAAALEYSQLLLRSMCLCLCSCIVGVFMVELNFSTQP